MKRIPEVKYGLAALVSLITFGVYLKSLQNEFFWDDFQYVVENPVIRSFNIDFFRWAFFDFYAANWHPLTWISHALDYAVWGLNPLGHHLTNNILHAVNTFLVVLLVVRLIEVANLFIIHNSSAPVRTQADSPGRTDPPAAGDSRFTLIAAAVTGLLFGLHPVHVESVAWVAERKDLLCALFYLLSVLAYVRYAGRGNPLWLPFFGRPQGAAPTRPYFLSLLFFSLALLSKPMAVSLPFVLLILDWYPFNRVNSLKTFRVAFVEKIPFIALSLVSSVLTILAQRSGGSFISIGSSPLSARLFVAAKSLVAYLWNMIVPINLVPLYPYPRNASLLSSEYLLPVMLVIGITIACAGVASKRKLWPAVWSYYVITLLPVLGIVRVGSQSMADRYTYLPGIGPFLIAGLATAWVYGMVNSVSALGNSSRSFEPATERPGLSSKGVLLKTICFAAAVIVFASMTYLTARQIGIWRHNLGLWNYVIEKKSSSATLAYYVRGLTFEKMNRPDEALKDYNTVITLEPFHLNVYYSRGRLFERMGLVDEAMEDYGAIIAADPFSYEAYNCRGILYSRTGSFERAIEDFNRSIAINPGFAPAHNNRGITYSLLDQDDKALQDFNLAIELGQNYSDAYLSRGKLYLKTGNQEYAVPDFQKACAWGREEGCNAVAALRTIHK